MNAGIIAEPSCPRRRVPGQRTPVPALLFGLAAEEHERGVLDIARSYARRLPHAEEANPGEDTQGCNDALLTRACCRPELTLHRRRSVVLAFRLGPAPRNAPVERQDRGREDAQVLRGPDSGEDAAHARRGLALVGPHGQALGQDLLRAQVWALSLGLHQLVDCGSVTSSRRRSPVKTACALMLPSPSARAASSHISLAARKVAAVPPHRGASAPCIAMPRALSGVGCPDEAPWDSGSPLRPSGWPAWNNQLQ